MRVLVITPDYPPALGGIQVLVHRLVVNWPQDDVRVVSIGTSDRNRRNVSGSPWQRPSLGHRAAVILLNVRAVLASIGFRPHIVISAHVVASPAAIAINTLLHTPYLQYIHAREVTHNVRLAALAVRRAAAVIAVSRYALSLVSDLGGASRMEVVHPGVDPTPTPTSAARSGRPTVIVVARLDDLYKGHDVLIRSMPLVKAVVPGAQLLIVGDGNLRSHYETLVEAIGASDAVTFLGPVSDSQRDELLAHAHVFAMPSRIPASGAGEGFGIVYLEAGMHSLPVVAGNSGGAVDAVLDHITGLLVDPSDHVQIARALTRLLVDRDLAMQLGAAGRERALLHSWTQMAEAVARVARDVVAARR